MGDCFTRLADRGTNAYAIPYPQPQQKIIPNFAQLFPQEQKDGPLYKQAEIFDASWKKLNKYAKRANEKLTHLAAASAACLITGIFIYAVSFAPDIKFAAAAYRCVAIILIALSALVALTHTYCKKKWKKEYSAQQQDYYHDSKYAVFFQKIATSDRTQL